MTDVGYAALQIIPSFKGFQGKLESGSAGALVAAGRTGGGKFGDSAGREAAHRFGLSFGRLAAGAAGLYGLDKVKDLFLDSIDIASDVSESTNKVRQIFGDAADDILKFSGTADKALGQSVVQARDAASQFGIFGKAAGLSGDDLSSFAIQMDTLAGDLASFNNTSPEQAIEAIGAALRGETEPIRAYGVLLDDATLRQQALKMGLIDTTKDALTPQQRVLAAQAQILKQTSDAQGDFHRTSGGLANQQRILAASFENAKGKLGRGLLPIMTDAVHWLNREGVPAFEDFSRWFTRKGVPAIQDFVDEVRPLGESLLPVLGDTLGTVRDVLSEAAPYAKDMVDAFNGMPDWARKAIIGGGLAAAAGSKLGLGSLVTGGKGGGGGLLGGISKAAPLPVYVVNDLPGGTDIPGGGKPGGGLKNTAVKAGGYGLAAAAVGYMGYEGYQAAGNAFQGATAPGGGFVPSGGAGAMGSSGSGPSQADLAMFDKQIAFQKALESAATDGNLAKMVSLYERYEKVLGATVTRQLTASDANAVFADKFDQSLTEFSAKFKTLPKKLQTDIVLKGVPESRKAAADLARQYHLTEGQRNTLFRALGIPEAKTQTVGLLEMYDKARGPVQGHVSVDTSAAEANLNRVLNLMAAIARRPTVPSAPGVLPGEAGRTAAPRTPARPRPVKLHVGEREFNAYLDERIGSNDDLIQERNRAGGSR